MWVLRYSLVIVQIWRLYVVFMSDWRVIVFPVGNQSSGYTALY